MERHEKAHARYLAYSLFGELLHGGVREGHLPRLRAVPDLAVTLPDPLSWKEMAAAHQQLWGFHLFPFESVFLDPQGLVGTRNERLLAHYHKAGFTPRAESADHLAAELQFLAWLSWQEARLLSEGDGSSLAAAQNQQRAFLEEHLLRWLPSLEAAVRRHHAPFYIALLALARAVVTEHYTALQGASPPDFSLPDAPSLLEDPRTGLRDIATFMVTPAYSGLFLSRHDWQQLARGIGVPHGFGSRQQVAETLLRATAQYDSLSTLLAGFDRLLARERATLGEWSGTPHLGTLISPWLSRLEDTRQLLAKLVMQVEKVANPSSTH